MSNKPNFGPPQIMTPQGLTGSQGRPSNGKPVQLNIPIKDTKLITCSNCSGDVFLQGIQVRYISPILSSNGQAMYANIPAAMICGRCGKPLDPNAETDRNEKQPEEPCSQNPS